jgi:hypothetical protein
MKLLTAEPGRHTTVTDGDNVNTIETTGCCGDRARLQSFS